MKIAYVIDQYDNQNNGTTISAARFIAHLRERGHEVRVVATGRPAPDKFVVPSANFGIFDPLISGQGTTFARPELDTDLWIVAWDGDQIAGVVQNWIWPDENARLGVARGWLEHISVRRQWRRRGLARAITAASLVRLREAGMDEGMLGVDSENANGALGLYEGLGFVQASRAAAYQRDLDV
jgi:ribosomal protein S18 acetylase RimI-like enzyme